MKLTILLLLLLPSFSLAAMPNVLLIYTDDQGYGDASCLNPDAKFQTPNLDRLAREGITFTDAHSSDTVCTPSRYGLLTGRYSWRTTLKRGVFGAEKKCLIEAGRMTVASLLRDNGYQTAMVGKWHLGMDFPGEAGDRDWSQPVRDMPLDKGFEYFYGIPASMNYGVLAWFEGRHAAVPPTLYTAKKPNRIALSDYRIKPPYQKTPQETKKKLRVKGMETAPDFVDSECLTRFTDKAIEWMSKAKSSDKPFFVYLPYTSPHKPVIPLKQFRGKGEAGAYGEFMIETDHHIGRILQFLDENELADDTLIIFTSDNGPENTWRERIKKFEHHSNHVYREGKRSIYEGGHRVPFFVRWPNGIKQPGRTFAGCVCQTDVLATIAELIGAELPADAGEDSQSFFPILSNQERAKRLPSIHHSVGGGFAIRDGNWKLIMPHKKQKMELYDLSSDKSEKNNLVNDHPDRVKVLTDKLTTIVSQGRSTPGDPQRNDTPYWDALTWMTAEEYPDDSANVAPIHRHGAALRLRGTTIAELKQTDAGNHLPTVQAPPWKKHVVVPKVNTAINSAVASDFDGDGSMDIISSYDGKVVLLRGPDWKPQTIHVFDPADSRNKPRKSCIHSCLMDVDRDGELDWSEIGYAKILSTD